MEEIRNLCEQICFLPNEADARVRLSSTREPILSWVRADGQLPQVLVVVS